MMGILSDLDKKLTDNMYKHGSEFTDAAVDLPQTVLYTVEELMAFIEPDARDTVKSQILGLIQEYKIDKSGSGVEHDRAD
ncbi:conserved hypothetical protein [Mesorhizobium metallidurans STM 2683]|uniref:Uncharacterized protein n=1 Tax=Mesorhizobium metallidurans STM 2683 TaxID=1297569 RepID=M5ENG8_9HYPH|nr:hypothetical protein [Mesorhizobium metallidurans]CCV05720.1 conserved hypothetical protein [Mesorhizobium metallidurans STM 2683]